MLGPTVPLAMPEIQLGGSKGPGTLITRESMGLINKAMLSVDVRRERLPSAASCTREQYATPCETNAV